MDRKQAEKLARKTLEHSFDEANFGELADELLKRADRPAKAVPIIPTLPFDKYIGAAKRIGQYKTPGKPSAQIDLLVVKLKDERSLERARVMQRNFIASYLKGRADAALIAFIPSGESQGKWRFSFVRLDYTFDEDNKPKTEFTPARRYSFLVGKGRNCRTAQERILKILAQDAPPTLDAIQDIFAVEPLNKEFYERVYRWYERAQNEVVFPNDRRKGDESDNHIETSLIRLLTRLMFVWFIKEKRLVKSDLFELANLKEIIKWDEESSFYKAVLQNLFFATLNVEIKNRKFRRDGAGYGVQYRYRYYKLVKDEKKWEDLFKQTPFMNGGLFTSLDRRLDKDDPRDAKEIARFKESGRNEPTMLRMEGFSDRDDIALKVPNSLFFSENGGAEGLIDIFEQYQFTVEESTPLDVEVALDPELLGQIFENLLATYNPETREVARKGTGSYYTPREIVSYMVDESLKAYFKQSEIADDTIAALFDEHGEQQPLSDAEAQAVIEAINKLKILDPACGSGAFPMGVLQRLVDILAFIDPKNKKYKDAQLTAARQITDDKSQKAAKEAIEITFSKANKFNSYGRKLSLIKDVLYGVDIQPIAVQITKLRFFISLAIEQHANDDQTQNYGISALPNLESKFVIADALIALRVNKSQIAMLGDAVEKLEREIAQLRDNYFSTSEVSKKNKLIKADKEKRRELSKILEPGGFGAAWKIAAWDFTTQTEEADWFDPRRMFGVTDGFDIVIGNPPYVQLQKDGGRLANLYASENYATFTRMGDIYCLFYERGLALSRNGGHLCYITSNKWMRAGYGEKTRRFFTNHNPLNLIDLGPDIFDAAVDTNILLVQRADNQNQLRGLNLQKPEEGYLTTEHITDQTADSAPLDIANFDAKASWFIGNSAEIGLKDKVAQYGTPLKDWDISINYGIKTGYNKAFIIDETKRQQILTACAYEDERNRTADIIKPVLRGKDIKRYKNSWASLYLLFIPWHFPLHSRNIEGASAEAEDSFREQYPAVYNHLLQHKDRLSKRNKSETGIRYEWYALQRCANTYLAEFDKEKVIYPNMTKFLPFIFDSDKYFTNEKCFILTGGNLKYLLGILNSQVIKKWIRQNLPDLKGGTRELRKIFMKNLPVPKITKENAELAEQIERLADEILAAKAADPKANTSAQERDIDELVYELYGLTKPEIDLIEGAVGGE